MPKQAPLPDGYVIGPEDILIIVFWREKDLSTEVVVRPDGRISIPLLQDVDAAGLTPEQLRDKLNAQAAERYVEDPNATVVVKEINSRRVFITGHGQQTRSLSVDVADNGRAAHRDGGRAAGICGRRRTSRSCGWKMAHRSAIASITRTSHERKNLKQNIALMPGDTVLVP